MKKVVLFHSKTCPHCVVMMPEWEKLKKKIEEHNKKSSDKITIITKERDEMDNSEMDLIMGFPTILIYRDSDEPEDYEGQRKAEDIYLTIIGKNKASGSQMGGFMKKSFDRGRCSKNYQICKLKYLKAKRNYNKRN